MHTAKICAALAAGIATAADASVTLMSCDFNSLTAGQLTATANGTTVGQGGWYAYTTSTTSPTANFNIAADPVAGGTHGNVLQMNGGTTQIGNNGDRSAWTNDVHNNAAGRDPGDTLFVATFDFYVGGLSTSKNRVGALMYDSTGTKVLSGVYLQPNTRQMYIMAYSTSGSTTANTAYAIGTSGLLSLNTWCTLRCTFDMSTGIAQAGYYNATTGSWTMFTQAGAATGTAVDRFTLSSTINQSANNSAGASIGYYDNIDVQAMPAPGSAAILAIAGLVGGARRRR